LAQPTISIAYLSNQFPSAVEPYISDEIAALRKQGFTILPCSARRTDGKPLEGSRETLAAETLYLEPLQIDFGFRALWLCAREHKVLASLLRRILWHGNESFGRRARALLHTWLGAYYALLLEGRGVQHIHVHHGYFSSWVAMVAAMLLRIEFSMTLHGSDLLLHGAYLDLKLKHCRFCLTVSEFNRNYIFEHYPGVDAGKLGVQRIGVDTDNICSNNLLRQCDQQFTILAVGRLHAVKNHAFLVRACRQLKDLGLDFQCLIAGEGPERHLLKCLIRNLGLKSEVKLLGHMARSQLDVLYATSDLVALTSRSEGIPLVLMEAMARRAVVLAPAITGIPELVIDGETGFLYQPGSLEDFVAHVTDISRLRSALNPVKAAARAHVIERFDPKKNLTALAELFRRQLLTTQESHADPVLQ